jgi:hypothetical protein
VFARFLGFDEKMSFLDGFGKLSIERSVKN